MRLIRKKKAPGVKLSQITESGYYWGIVVPRNNYNHNVPAILSIWVTLKPHQSEYIVQGINGVRVTDSQHDKLVIWPEKIESPPDDFLKQTT